jgi:pteridine reductase
MPAQKVAMITGSGSRRIGNTVARTLAERRYSVVLHYHRSANEAAQTVTELESRGVAAMAIEADLRHESDVDRLVQAALTRFGRIDVLVNSAAVWSPKPLEKVTAADVQHHFEVNTLGTFLCSQRVGLVMVEQPEGGSIITIGDWAIGRPYRDYAAYFASKGAIPALTRSLAVELGSRNPRVRVNCILPGPVMLPPDMPQAERDRVVQSTLVKHEGRPENIAQAVLFLIENDFVTGACVPVDGGRSIYAAGE